MSNPTFSSSSWNQKQSKIKRVSPQDKYSIENKTTGSNQVYTSSDDFEVKGIGSILLKQDYTMLFYTNEKLGITIESATVTLKDKNDKILVELKIDNNQITLHRIYNSEKQDSKPDITENIKNKTKQPMFPSTQIAPIVLYRKIWIQVNKLINEIKVCYGDVSNTTNTLFEYNFQNDTKIFHDTNQTSDVSFPMPTGLQNNYNPRLKNILAEACSYSVDVVTSEDQTDQSFDDFFQIRFMTNVQVYSSIMQKNPSFFTKNAPLGNMPKQIQTLYSYLQDSSLDRLPDFEANTLNLKIQRQEYLNWHDFPFAVQNSLLTPAGYYPAVEGQTTRVPYGMLNHLYEWKIKKPYQPIDFTKYKNKEEMLQDIYQNRQGYIRLELTDHMGNAPGGMAVVEVWPPYNCSMVHNHGDAYGLIKVQSGILQVQNFNELNFDAKEGIQTPFQSMTYQEGDYTWLSQYSYAIHRLINLHPQTCMTIQAYYKGNNTNEYFTFVEKKEATEKKQIQEGDKPNYQNDSLWEFYPQNDWINYINTVNDDNIWKSLYLQDEKEGKDPNNPETSRSIKYEAYVRNIIDRYELPYIIGDRNRLDRQKFNTKTVQSKHPEVWSMQPTRIYKPTFYQLALILKDSYDYGSNWGRNSPSWVTSDSKKVACILENDHNENTQAVIKQLKDKQYQVVQYKDFKSFKADAEKYSKYLKKGNKQIAIIDGLQHYQNFLVNRSASSKLFQEVCNAGLDYRVGVSLNKTSKDNTNALINNGVTFQVPNFKQIVQQIVKMTQQ